jgi:hypothetical protein
MPPDGEKNGGGRPDAPLPPGANPPPEPEHLIQ